MHPAPYAVIHPLTVELTGPDGPTPAAAELRYHLSDPYAVALAFFTGGTEVVWMFGRDLLMRGVFEPEGDGDVQVFPSLESDGRAVVLLTLRSPEGEALVKLRTKDVLGFLARSTRAVWPGREGEHVNTDAAIASLLVGD